MPFDKKRNDIEEDPELVAEREYESLSSGSGGSGGKKNKTGVVANGSKTATATANGVVSNGEEKKENKADAVSIGSNGKGAVNFKEAKADRKKRFRGVSGSSIKKDGGRFDLGMEDLDQYDDVSDNEYDEMARYINTNYNDLAECESDEFSNDGLREYSPLPAEAIRLRTALVDAIKDPSTDEALHLMTESLIEYFDEGARLEVIERVLDDMVMSDEWTSSGAIDRMAEYKLVTLLSKIIHQGLISLDAFDNHFKRNSGDSQTLRLMRAGVNFYKADALEMKGDLLNVPPKEITELAEDLTRSGEVSCVKEALTACPFLHADIIFQVCNSAINSMNMDVIFNASNTFKDLIAKKIMTVAAVNTGVSRFLVELRDTEVDLPAASSLAFLLVSYCVESPACIDHKVYRKCPRPRKFLRKRTMSSGRLSIREDAEEDCNEANYLQLS